jgi:hypothetical protein
VSLTWQVVADVLDVAGPVLAEVFVLWADEAGVHLTGPCGPAPWYIEIGDGQDPMAVVRRLSGSLLGEPRLLHSTSWRRARTGIVLSFVAALAPALVVGLPSVPVGRQELARGQAATAPAGIAAEQVLEHGLRHLAWLAQDDPAIRDALDPAWEAALSSYVPEPFRHLG